MFNYFCNNLVGFEIRRKAFQKCSPPQKENEKRFVEKHPNIHENRKHILWRFRYGKIQGTRQSGRMVKYNVRGQTIN